MRLSQVPEKYVKAVQDMYEGCVTTVRCAMGLTEEFRVKLDYIRDQC